MGFGEARGYPAGHQQLRRLTQLVEEAGHRDLRDARGPLGLTQRQSNGKFTRDEADDLIARLETDGRTAPDGDADAPPRPSARERRQSETLAPIPDHVLAAELQRRGWIVAEP